MAEQLYSKLGDAPAEESNAHHRQDSTPIPSPLQVYLCLSSQEGIHRLLPKLAQQVPQC